MTILRRFTPTPSIVAPRAAAVAATTTTAAAAPAATPQGTHQTHHGHSRPHGAGGHGRHKAGWHGPSARPKRSTRPQRKGRRRGANGLPSDDDEHDYQSHEGQASGTAPVGLREQSQDGGDDQDEGGGERSRQDRRARVRGHGERADDPAGGRRLGRLFDSKVPVQRYVKGTIGVVAQAVVDHGLTQAAQHGNAAQAASALRKLQLGLLGGARPGGRLDRGGLARVAEHLLAHYVRPALPEGGFKPSVVMLHLMLPMLLLQLQVPRNEEQTALTIARLLVQARRNER